MKVFRYLRDWIRYVYAGLVFGRACQRFPGAPWLGLWQRDVESMRPKWGKS